MTSLSTLFGQDIVLRGLRKALDSDCIAGTYLFVGAEGVGKGAVARAFAQAAACLTPTRNPFDACGACESCRLANLGSHPDIVTVAPAGEQLQVWQFWDRDNRPTSGVLSHTLSYAPIIGRRRVYIIERADTLNESAANSLLKVLEEPPPYALFILLGPYAGRLLPTIVSRSQMVRLGSVPAVELAAYLQSVFSVEPERASMLAVYSEGRIGQAVRLARHPLVTEEIAHILDFAESLPNAPRVRALRLAEQMRKLAAQVRALVGEETQVVETAPGDPDNPDGAAAPKEKTSRRQVAAVFDLLLAFYRDLLTLNVGGDANRLVIRDRAKQMRQLSSEGSAVRWLACIDALLLARRRLDANANVTLVSEVLAMALVSM